MEVDTLYSTLFSQERQRRLKEDVTNASTY